MKKHQFKKPLITIIKIKKEEIIVTSGVIKITDALFGNGNSGANVG